MERGRWAGMALIGAGLFLLVGFPGLSEILPGISHAGGHALIAVGAALLTLGVAGLWARYANAVAGSGRNGLTLGVVGSFLLFLGNGIEWLLGEQAGWAIFMVGALMQLIGAAIFGRAALRANLLPGWGVWPLIGGAIGSLALVLIMVSIIAIGAIVRGQRNEGGGTPPPMLTIPIAIMIGPGWALMGAAAYTDATRRRSPKGAPQRA